jgi:hypothetical protein
VMDGRDITMGSMFTEPTRSRIYLENYGGFFLHCGFTTMGVPGASDKHPLHGELPNAHYDHAFLELGEDEHGAYLALGGSYQHTVAFGYNYKAEPLVKLYAGSSLFHILLDVTNLKKSGMEYMYLGHTNFRPVDNGRLVYSAAVSPKTVRVRTNIPSHTNPGPGFREFLDELAKNPEKHHILKPGMSFDPEVVFYIDYLTDEKGWAHSMQVHPDGAADYLAHRPDQVDHGVRWICRTADQQALGLLLAATAEPEGYTAEKAKGNVKVLPAGGKFHFEQVVGTLTPSEAKKMEAKIEKIVK